MYTPFNVNVGSCHYFIFINDAVMNTHGYILSSHLQVYLQRKFLEANLLGPRLWGFVILIDIDQFVMEIIPINSSIEIHERAFPLTQHVIKHYNSCHSDKVKMASDCDFKWCFSLVRKLASFLKCKSFIFLFLRNVSLQTFEGDALKMYLIDLFKIV